MLTPSRPASASAARRPAASISPSLPTAASRAPKRGSTSPASPAPASRCARCRSTSSWPAACRPEGGQLAAILRRGGAVIGRVQARLQPLGPAAGSWTTRLMAAPLAGGIRYNGPAEVPMSFANMPSHQLTGPIGIAADFSGRVDARNSPAWSAPTTSPIINETLRDARHQPRGRRPLQLARPLRDRPAFRPRRPRHRRGPRHDRPRFGRGLPDRPPAPVPERAAGAQRRPRRDRDRQPPHRQRPQRRLDHRHARSRRGPLPDRPPGRRRGAAARRRPPPRRAAAPAQPAECRKGRAEHLAARHPPQRQQPGLRLRHGPGIRMARRPARRGHDRDARDRRPGRPDPRHAGPRRAAASG